MSRVETIRRIMAESIIVNTLQFGKSRAKVYGAMYEGSMVLVYHDMILYFEMWHHHSSETYMTEDEVLENIDLKGLKIDDRYYDLYWYARWYNEKFYLHPDGWFGFTPWAVKLEKEINEIGMRNDEKVEGDLLKLGFKRIPELDGLK